MQTILQLLEKAGGWYPGLYLAIPNAPYLELVIEAMDESGPCGLPALSVCQYSQQNSDPMRDPEMCFELGLSGGAHLNPFYWRNDYIGVKQWSRFVIGTDYCFIAGCTCSTSTVPRHGTATCADKVSLRRSSKPNTYAANPSFPYHRGGNTADVCRSTIRSPFTRAS